MSYILNLYVFVHFFVSSSYSTLIQYSGGFFVLFFFSTRDDGKLKLPLVTSRGSEEMVLSIYRIRGKLNTV